MVKPKLHRKSSMLFWILLIFFILALAILLVPRVVAAIYSAPRTYSPGDVPPAPVAIVFGAGLNRNGTPTPVLQDRVATAADLYFSGKVKKLLMSGDNRYINYNEPGAMQAYAVKLGVPEADIVLDYAGRRTYDTCYRARAIFGVEEAILVTQGYHMPRALYTCNMLGVRSTGVASDLRQYSRQPYLVWNIRELPAMLVAMWQVHISHPAPVLGDREPIFP